MKKLFFRVTLLMISLGGLYFGENSNAEGLNEVKTQGIEVNLNSRAVTSYVFNHYPPGYYKGKRIIAKQYLGQGQYRGYYN